MNLGGAVNTFTEESCPAYFEDDVTGTITLYFNRGALGSEDIYASTLQPDETFGQAVLVGELSSTYRDVRPAIWKDGLVMFLDSNRPGTLGGLDLWVSTRPSTADLFPWSAPVHLVSVVNSPASVDARPVLFLTALNSTSTRTVPVVTEEMDINQKWNENVGDKLPEVKQGQTLVDEKIRKL